VTLSLSFRAVVMLQPQVLPHVALALLEQKKQALLNEEPLPLHLRVECVRQCQFP
jgi:hypothetical protein